MAHLQYIKKNETNVHGRLPALQVDLWAVLRSLVKAFDYRICTGDCSLVHAVMLC